MDPVAQIDRLLGSTWRASVGGAFRALEAQFTDIAKARPADAIPALVHWLDHPDVDVAGTAAEVLLAYADPVALEDGRRPDRRECVTVAGCRRARRLERAAADPAYANVAGEFKALAKRLRAAPVTPK